MTDGQREALRQRISLLQYLQQRGWQPIRQGASDEVAGLCPLHRETYPSFYVNRRKQVFYCHGCGRGGDLVRLIELLDRVSFPEALARLPLDVSPRQVLAEAFGFYQTQLARSSEAGRYLSSRGIHAPAVIARMRIGYAPGACLRAHLEALGYARTSLERCGLIDPQGRDRLWRCLVFPLEEAGNLYGRAIDDGRVPRHCFLPRPKGGLYGWKLARQFPNLIVVEGLLDLAALWQAGFPQTVAALGSHLNARQMGELGDSLAQTVYLCLDADEAGAQVARRLAGRLRTAGIDARRVALPWGSDPGRFLAEGATAADFQRCLDRARP
jgi:DNA primase